MTVGKLSVSLAEGKYYVGFDDEFSLLKRVDTHIDLVLG